MVISWSVERKENICMEKRRQEEKMIKCKDCIFCIREKCVNPESDEDGMKVFEEYDSCGVGKKSTFGINKLQRFALIKAGARE